MADTTHEASNGARPAASAAVARPESLKQELLEVLRTVLPEDAAVDDETLSAVAKAIHHTRWVPLPERVVLNEELSDLHSSREFIQLLRSKQVNVSRVKRAMEYEYELECLQIELVKLQRWVQATGRRLAILFEGRDAAGKGGTIRRFIEHLNPRAMRVVALPKPTEDETGQWYFQRYMRQLPNRGEIVFFDRSWYNRAVVEPVNGFCTPEQYERFMRQVPEFEHMLVEDGVDMVKFWFSISKEVQAARFESRRNNPLKHWKLSPIDERSQDLWNSYTKYKEKMFSRTHTSFSPWIIVKANDKRSARLESIRYALSLFDYDDKEGARVSLIPDPDIVGRFHRSALRID
ncbi:MAG: polyphosphate kinase 2 [Dehalococcoidia bacterium]|nr:polyphosphate kinase 2 [Dehalococcoidia bacterium]